MPKPNQPETLTVIVDDQNDHGDDDGSVGCEGGARSSSRESKIFSDRPSTPLDTAVKQAAEKLIGKTSS